MRNMIRKPTRLAPGRASSQQKNKSENPCPFFSYPPALLFFCLFLISSLFFFCFSKKPLSTAASRKQKTPLCRSPLLLFFSSFSQSCLPQQAHRISSHLPAQNLCLPFSLRAPKHSSPIMPSPGKIKIKIPKKSPGFRGSTNMPLFDRVHECKECEH